MGVDEVELEPVTQLEAELEHVGVHLLYPADEREHVLGKLGLADAVHDDAVADLVGG
jgi:hypothetical protein